MVHVAIMNKSWDFIEKIASGEKTIESRWYNTKRIPWDAIHQGDTVYFKNSGESVSYRATVAKVLQYDGLTEPTVLKLLQKYHGQIGIISDEIETFFDLFKDKKICILIFLTNVECVTPFAIDKRGFGAMSAWITVERIEQIQKRIDIV
jgi:ASC-1-like (ASCH) protein